MQKAKKAPHRYRSWAPWANDRYADRVLARRDPDVKLMWPRMRLMRAGLPVHDMAPSARLIPCWCAVNALLARTPERPVTGWEAIPNDLVTNESYQVSTLTRELIVYFKPTAKLVGEVAAFLAGDRDG